MMTTSNLSRLRVFAWLEGFSFLLLMGVTMPLKYMLGMPTPNYIVGMAHGILFIGYCLLVLKVRSERKWNYKKTFYALIASLLPFGTFVADTKIFKPEMSNEIK